MKQRIQLVLSGIPLVDNAWGGFYRSGTYLLTGPRKSGKTFLALQFAQECVKQNEVCLYFTTSRPKDLMINAASINFDLQECVDESRVIIVRVNPPGDIESLKNPDEYLTGYIRDIVTVTEQYQPSKIVFDELTPFIGFTDTKKLKDVFIETCELIEEGGVTSLFIIGEPSVQPARDIADLLSEYSTGIIYLKKKESEGITTGGTIKIVPNIGHTEGQFKTGFYIEPHKGIVTEPELRSKISKPAAQSGISNYKPLSEINASGESYFSPIFYDIKEFHLMLNNQIALFKSTGQIFSVVSIYLDPEAVNQGLLTINQMKNSVRLSSDKKDKICVQRNKIIVLLSKEGQKSVNHLIARVKENLPGSDDDYISKVSQYISVNSIQIDNHINSADDIFQMMAIEQYQD